jgi:hypothetical protein
MKVLLVVEREQSDGRISGMVWATTSADPELIETKTFLGEAALRVWLAGIATRYGPSNITVDWATLGTDARLIAAVRDFVSA